MTRATDLTTQPDAAPLAFSIETFCKTHCLSRSMFYKLLNAGDGPRRMRVGRRTLISCEAAADWRQAMELRAAVVAKLH